MRTGCRCINVHVGSYALVSFGQHIQLLHDYFMQCQLLNMTIAVLISVTNNLSGDFVTTRSMAHRPDRYQDQVLSNNGIYLRKGRYFIFTSKWVLV